MDYTSLPTQQGPSALLGVLAVGLPFLLAVFFIVWLAFAILMIASAWRVYTKAGQPGWAAIIPIYNVIVLLEIVERPIWWIIFMFIPIANIVVAIILAHRLAVVFGHGVGFTLGLMFLSPIFYPILAFGKSVYQPAGTSPVVPIPVPAPLGSPVSGAFVPSATPPAPPHKSHAWIWILVILLVFSLLATGAWGFYSSYQSYSEKYKNLQFDDLTEPSAPLSNFAPEDEEVVPIVPAAPVSASTSTIGTSTPVPAPAPAKTWHQVVTFSDSSTGITGFGNSSEFSIKGASFRLLWSATPGKTSSTMSISANGVANHSYGCDFLNIPIAPGSGTLNCDKTGSFYLKLKPNYNTPWQISVE